ncbi:MMPL family transporter [Pseudactinotalea sp.]|uniref:MMPL family transporter n=1 Tax=Pseudactinotalea sp. TaxID=1926260 RepID=UPI003B3A36EE
MANLLYRIGVGAARRAWLVIVSWVVVLGLAAGAFLAFGGTLVSSFSIPGTETDRVNGLLEENLGTTGSSASVVFHTDDGSAIDEGQQAEIAAALAEVGELDGVEATVDPYATVAQMQEQAAGLDAQLATNAENTTELTTGLEGLQAALAEAQAAGAPEAQIAEMTGQIEEMQGQLAGLAVEKEQLELGQQLMGFAAEIQTVSDDGSAAMGVVMFEGDAIGVAQELKDAVIETLTDGAPDGVTVDFSSQIATSVEGIVGPGEIVGLLVAALVLLLMFRAAFPAITPVLSSLVGVGVGVAGAMAFSDAVEMSSVTPVLGLMLGLAVGIDYSLFILNRHRTQVRAGMGVSESIGLANGTAGNAVVFAGATVFVALLALNVSGIGFLGLMGTVGAACVLVAVLVAVTFTPALLGLVGQRVLRRSERGSEPVRTTSPGAMKTSHAVISIVAGVAVLGVVALPALDMRLGLPDGSTESADSTQYQAYSITAEQFGAGQNGPLLVTASLEQPMEEINQLPTQVDIAEALMALDDVVAVAPIGISDDADFIAFQVVPVDGPSSESTEDLVHTLRGLEVLDGGATLGVAGFASGNIDISERLADTLPLYLIVVVGLSLIILVLVFRSLVLPLLATAGFVLSLVAALGATTAIFQWGWLGSVFGVNEAGPLLSFAPLIITGVLFGLAMDYQLFLASAMREAYAHGTPAREAVTAGRHQSRAVVIAAASIMIAVFGGFTFSHLTMIRPLGFGLAVGVLFDAFVVRLLLVSAAMHLVGNKVWWLPRWLDRILPNVDVEGSALERDHPVPHAEESESGDEASDDEKEPAAV